MTKQLSVKSGIQNVLAANMKAVKSVLPKHLTPEKVLRVAYIAIEQSPKLAQCSQASLINAVLESSILGLEISTPLGHAHLVPYGKKAQLIIGYNGFMELAFRSGKISKFTVQAVYAKDTFAYRYGTNAFIEHVPSDDEIVGDLKYAYAITQFKDGSYEFEVVNKRTAMAAKARSAAKNKKDSPWNTTDEYQMWCKTAVRKLAKRLPMSPEIQRAAFIDEYAEAGVSQGISHIPDVADDMFENATDLTKKLQNADSDASGDADSTISENIESDINSESKASGSQTPTARQEIIAIIKSHLRQDIDQALYNLNMSELTEIDDLSHADAKSLLEMIKEVKNDKH